MVLGVVFPLSRQMSTRRETPSVWSAQHSSPARDVVCMRFSSLPPRGFCPDAGCRVPVRLLIFTRQGYCCSVTNRRWFLSSPAIRMLPVSTLALVHRGHPTEMFRFRLMTSSKRTINRQLESFYLLSGIASASGKKSGWLLVSPLVIIFRLCTSLAQTVLTLPPPSTWPPYSTMCSHALTVQRHQAFFAQPSISSRPKSMSHLPAR